MKTHILTIATRESSLAIWQANWVRTQLEKLHPGLKVCLLGLTTKADLMLDIPLTQVGGKGLFVKELEQALLDGRADIAVHSMKDVPMEFPPGLCLPVMCEREDPRDVLVSNQFTTLADLPFNAVIGTSSFRRQSQISAIRKDLHMEALRGNVNTRLAKLDRGKYTAIILAAAGLIRLGFQNRISSFMSLDDSLPAAGQGVLGIECREDDTKIRELIAPLNHLDTALCVTAERAMCKQIGGGCQVPVAAYAEKQDDKIYLRGLVGKIDGSLLLRASYTAGSDKAELIGVKVAEQLLASGAEEILQGVPK